MFGHCLGFAFAKRKSLQPDLIKTLILLINGILLLVLMGEDY
ncbi:MAG: hypothetical protein BMS9Abin02_1165 [Anaerolineae bacterium]|nr:MAG: hypothetical protein BMS9Abin02_1165 [Anaerolineae bacterium]